jgi:iron complex transport system ATP-binding protein
LGKLTREMGKTIIFTTHDLGIAIRETDKLWLLSHDGFFHGSPEDLVLNGIIAKTFNTPKVAFDARKGDFSIKKTYKPFFYITGKSSVVHWTRNAIEKDGFTVIDKASELLPAIDVEQTQNGYSWKVSFKGKLTELTSIFDLRNFIRNNFVPEN